jgi:hypothetical protein
MKKELHINHSEKKTFFDFIYQFILSIDNELIIICPYIKVNILDCLLLHCPAKKTTIITTWNLKDFQCGSSDVELYTYCKEKKIYLFINPRIHLKTFIKDYRSCIFGTANISNHGLALCDNYNYELATLIGELDRNSVIYFKTILKESVIVNDDVYQMYKAEFNKLKPLEEITEPDMKSVKPRSEFLISALPMSRNIDILYEIYSKDIDHIEYGEDLQCAIHDIVLYKIPPHLTKEKFIDFLKKEFFASQFIIKLLDFIKNQQYFGRVKEWIQQNCEDVPLPSRRDLTGNIQVLYKWIVELSDGKYKVDIPGSHSERIYKVT